MQRKWSTNTLFYLLNDCQSAHTEALRIGDLKVALSGFQSICAFTNNVAGKTGKHPER